jgi:hypothetical protein
MLSNEEFLQLIMGEDWGTTHVTDFTYDPGAIPGDKQLISWKGDYFYNHTFSNGSNQYFTISHFDADDQGIARRRKALFRHTRVIVLDDVKEKLSMREVKKLPEPAWVLETSKGSEQWGYILDKPCADRSKVENLLDGLVANGLAPNGKDPGMKGVTRYVRLPEGYNNKASKLVEGKPFKCSMKVWQPFITTTIEALAKPFNVDLNALRRESRSDGASDIPDHPLLNIPDTIHIKEVRSAGRFDVTCPWVSEHTGDDDSGSAVFTNDDGSIGFKCHHGSCHERTSLHLMRYIESKEVGFAVKYMNWRSVQKFIDVSDVTFMADNPADEPEGKTVDDMLHDLQVLKDTDPALKETVNAVLKAVDSLPHYDKMRYHEEVCHKMKWKKKDFSLIIKELRDGWYAEKSKDGSFYDTIFYIKEQNQFYDYESRMFFSTDAFQNSFVHEDIEARKNALQSGRVVKVDKLDYAPNYDRTFKTDKTLYGNTWYGGDELQGKLGDISKWFEHFDVLGWTNERDHIIKFMAYTLQRPECKINHALVLGGREGIGKDFLLYPMMKAMGGNSTVVNGEELLSKFNEYLLCTKHLHLNEVEHSDHRESSAVMSKLKAMTTSPPDTLSINQKNISRISVRNIVNITMTTNSALPFRLQGLSRRFFAIWSDLRVRDHETYNMRDEWRTYWDESWAWMNQEENLQACIYYLRNLVDISNFNPSEAPPVTDYLRDIQEVSRSPAEATIDGFIKYKHLLFESDLMSIDDLYASLSIGECNFPAEMQVESRWFNKNRIARVMNGMDMCVKRRCRTQFNDASIYIIRNHNKYVGMKASELFDTYQHQMKIAMLNNALPMKRGNTLKAV